MLTTPRRAISYPNPDRSDRPDIPLHIYNIAIAADGSVVYNQGTAASRGSATHETSGGRLWWETDTSLLWYDDGTSWFSVGVNPNGSLAFTGSTSKLSFSGQSSGANIIESARVTGDTQDRLQILASGHLAWGPGNTVVDTALYRSGVGGLKTDGNFTADHFTSITTSTGTWVYTSYISADAQPHWVVQADGSMHWGPGGASTTDITITRFSAGILQLGASSQNFRLLQFVGSTGAIAYSVRSTSADTVDRFNLDSNGKMSWGPGGSTAIDTNLYRSAAGVLKTDGNLIINGAFQMDFLNAGSKLLFGSAADTNLYRQAVGVLQTDTALRVGGALTTGAVSGTPVIYFGGAGDTNLYRIGAGALKTDGQFQAGGIWVGGSEQFGTGGSQMELYGSSPRIAFTNTNMVSPSGRWQIYTFNDTINFWRSGFGDILEMSTTGVAALAGAPFLQSDGNNAMRVMRHPYGFHMHDEGGSTSIGGVSNIGSIAVTLTNAFAALTSYTANATNDGVICFITSYTGSGFTLNVRDVVGGGTAKTVGVFWRGLGTD